jgi:hypothetical protein
MVKKSSREKTTKVEKKEEKGRKKKRDKQWTKRSKIPQKKPKKKHQRQGTNIEHQHKTARDEQQKSLPQNHPNYHFSHALKISPIGSANSKRFFRKAWPRSKSQRNHNLV